MKFFLLCRLFHEVPFLEGIQTRAFVISEPGSSATTEELQVFSEMEQIQAIKKELMNESVSVLVSLILHLL